MSQIDEVQTEQPEGSLDALPILPLKDTVVFPESMTPLAIGQERSIRLVDEAVANERTIAHERPKEPMSAPAVGPTGPTRTPRAKRTSTGPEHRPSSTR